MHCAKNILARASWKVHTSITVGSRTGIRSSSSSNFGTWSLGGVVVLPASVLLKTYSSVDAAGVVTGVVIGVVKDDGVVVTVSFGLVGVVAAGFVLDTVTERFVVIFRNVTIEYGCKLRKELDSHRGRDSFGLLPGVVDTFWARFFFFCVSLLCVSHRFLSPIGCDLMRGGCFRRGYRIHFVTYSMD